jgi:hypothetical protein
MDANQVNPVFVFSLKRQLIPYVLKGSETPAEFRGMKKYSIHPIDDLIAICKNEIKISKRRR